MKRRAVLIVLALLCALGGIAPATAEDPPPTIVLSADRPIYLAGTTADLVYNVTAPFSGTHLKVVATLANGTVKTLFDLDVNSGVIHNALYMVVNTRIDAYVGGATEPSDTLSMPVRALVATQVLGYHATAGSYSVFPRGSSPRFRSATGPAWPGKRCLRHVVQRYYATGTHWRNVFTSACRVEGNQGRVDWTWLGKHRSGVKFRVRASFAGDVLNRANVGPWKYFRFHS